MTIFNFLLVSYVRNLHPLIKRNVTSMDNPIEQVKILLKTLVHYVTLTVLVTGNKRSMFDCSFYIISFFCKKKRSSEIAKFTCSKAVCKEYLIRPGQPCVFQRSLKQCCATNIICGKNFFRMVHMARHLIQMYFFFKLKIE